jgi:predicted dehydrogenase
MLIDGAGAEGGEADIIALEICDQYTLQADEFAAAVLAGTRVSSPLEDSVQNMLCIEAVQRSARSGRWETPEGR